MAGEVRQQRRLWFVIFQQSLETKASWPAERRPPGRGCRSARARPTASTTSARGPVAMGRVAATTTLAIKLPWWARPLLFFQFYFPHLVLLHFSIVGNWYLRLSSPWCWLTGWIIAGLCGGEIPTEASCCERIDSSYGLGDYHELMEVKLDCAVVGCCCWLCDWLIVW